MEIWHVAKQDPVCCNTCVLYAKEFFLDIICMSAKCLLLGLIVHLQIIWYILPNLEVLNFLP